ncbi:ribonuclease T2-like [Aricia agestis]|uniref:ribonuclease T2-like n=1 Tax=Aricia agestis TaxID=91739 RepID=UPI001C20513F|nr:ribonuclease T2-like [Aricia agestis]
MEWNQLLFLILVFQTLLITSDAFLRNSSIFDLDIFDYDDFRRSDAATTKNKCVDTEQRIAPAEDCFDYFILAVIWTFGYAYKQKLMGVQSRAKLGGQWVIHGLWPSWLHEENPNCVRYDQVFVEYRLKNEKFRGPLKDDNLHTFLSNNWYSIRQTPPKNLWDHEFKAHGSCATRARKIKDSVGYYREALRLFFNLNLNTLFNNNKYRAGDKMKLSQIVEILHEQVKKKVKVQFTPQKGGTENYLTELFICYNYNLEAIDCPYLESQDRNGDLEITFPANIPK